MKKTQLKRTGSNPLRKLKKKADIALQDWYRLNCPYDMCLICGYKAELRHHFILKSMSNRLRYDSINLIPLCSKCHYKAHFGSETLISAQIAFKKGRKWFDKIQRLSQEHINLTKKYLEEIIKKYETNS
jgi:5-methylcytosine-specific restriction endonuclease McrA